MNSVEQTYGWLERLNEDQIAKQIYEESVYGSEKKGTIKKIVVG